MRIVYIPYIGSSIPQMSGEITKPYTLYRSSDSAHEACDYIDMGFPDVYHDHGEVFAWFERATGKTVAYQTSESLAAYLESINGAREQSYYDTKGFFRMLGLRGLRSYGRREHDHEWLLEHYKPHDRYRDLKKFLMYWWRNNPRQFRSVRTFFDFFLTKGERARAWQNTPIPQPPVDATVLISPDHIRTRYPMLARAEHLFNPDFHVGLTAYGTYAIARSLGFSVKQARRIGRADNAIDVDRTPYGRTRSEMGNAPSRHFNLNAHDPAKGDTRLIWARRHLDAAVDLARHGNFDQAEQELGYGLHSIQDAFAHGQMSPFTHFVLGSIPDRVEYNPTAMYEATRATRAYLKTYLKRILRPPKADSKDKG